MGGLAVEREGEIVFGRASQAGLALAVVWMSESREEAGDKGKSDTGLQFPFQSVIPAPL